MKNRFHHATENPLGFPPLRQAVFPGDRVVLVPDPFVLQNGEILAITIAHLIESGVSPSDITVMMTGKEFEEEEKSGSLRGLFPDQWRNDIVFSGFHAYKADSCSLLCSRPDGEPVALARPLVDADVVIPIERHYPTPPFGHFGILSVLVPRFADLQTQIRFQASDRTEKREEIVARFADEIRETAEQLGVAMVIEVLTPDGKNIDGFLYGDPQKIARHLKKDSDKTDNPAENN